MMLSEEERSDVIYDGVDFLNQQRLITRLIKAGADPNAISRQEYVIFTAVRAIDLASGLKALLNHGADPDVKNQHGQSALHLLSSPILIRKPFSSDSRLHETGIRLLLQHGASILQPDAEGNTPLHCAAFGADLRILQLYLSTQAPEDPGFISNTKNSYREILLYWAAAGGKIDIMEYLLLRGLDVNAANTNGWTPLMCVLAPTLENHLPGARAKKSWEAIQAAKLLLFYGVDPLASIAKGWTPLHCLARYQDGDDKGNAAQLAEHLILRGANIEARALMLSEGKVVDIRLSDVVKLP